MLDITTLELLRLLGRGGQHQYFWQKAGHRSTWFAGNVPALPTSKDIYFGVHPANSIPATNRKGEAAQPHAVRPQLANIAAINCLFAEFDAKDFDGDKDAALEHIEQLEPTASVCIDSGGGYHCYWLLEEPWILQNDQDREQARQLQYAWVERVGGDSAAKDLCRVLRVPGTQNFKYKPARSVVMLWADLSALYELTELSKLCADAVEQAAPPIVEQPSRPEPDQDDELRRWGLKQLAGSIRRVQEAPDGQKHEALRNASRWLGGVVAAGGLTEQEAEQELYNAIADRAKDKRNALDTIRDGLAHGAQSPLEPPSARPVAQKSQSRPAGPEPDQGELTQSQRIIQQLKAWGYEFKLNLCGNTIEVSGTPITDFIRAELRTKARDANWERRLTAMEDAYITEAFHNSYHPVLDYLNGLKWDGQDHIGALAAKLSSSDAPVRYADGSSAPLHLVYLKRWLVGAVAKAMEQAQNMMLVLAGPQGIGKSGLASWLCSSLPEYFIEGAINTDDKDSSVRLMSKFIWEVGELDATTRKADVSALKDFITRRVVTVRKAFGQYDTVRPALASMIGTVNDNADGFLADTTGNRRFMVTKIIKIDWSYTKLIIDQIWAQAVALYRSGESWRLLPEEFAQQNETNKEYEKRSLTDDWVLEWFDLGPEAEGSYMSASQIVDHLGKKGKVFSGSPTAQNMEISAVMARLGVKRIRKGNSRVYANIAPLSEPANLITIGKVGGEVGGENSALQSPVANLPTSANLLDNRKISNTQQHPSTTHNPPHAKKVGEVGGDSLNSASQSPVANLDTDGNRLAVLGEVGGEQQTIEIPTAGAQLMRCDAAGRPDARGEFWKVEDGGQIVFGPSRFYALARDHQRRLLGRKQKWS